MSDPLAIVGIGCRFPGRVSGPRSFWSLLCAGVDAITEIPADRWDVDRFYDPDPSKAGKICTRHGGFVDDLALFDPGFFGISPREAGHMDPQQRMLMEVAWEAIEDAGLVVDRRQRTPASVFVGISNFDYPKAQRLVSELETITAHTATGNALGIAANRISYALNLVGPSIAVDTACSSSLVAVHLAAAASCGANARSRSRAASMPSSTVHLRGLLAATMLSPDGRCAPSTPAPTATCAARAPASSCSSGSPAPSPTATGSTPSSAAARSNQDGRTPGITRSQPGAGGTAPRGVYAEPASIARRRWPTSRPTAPARRGRSDRGARHRRRRRHGPARRRPCFIGSVKTNIGHLESGAGIAGLIKTALVLAHGAIPPNLHFSRPNPEIAFDRLRLRVPTALTPWPDGRPRIASVSSFGFGGTNAHVVLSADGLPVFEPDRPAALSPIRVAAPVGEAGAQRDELFCLSAHTHDSLRTLASRSADALDDGFWSAVPLHDLCRASIRRRLQQAHRLSAVARSHGELADRLRAFTRGETSPGMSSGEAATDRHTLGFVYCGQGPQWWRMGRQLFETEAVFRETILECDALLRRDADWSLVAELTADEARSRLDVTAFAQPAIFALQAGLTRLWASWGIAPDAVAGHSVGEVAAAWAAGALALGDAVRVIYHRGRTMDHATALGGRMLAVGLSPDEAAPYLAEWRDRLAIGAVNSPASVTVSGDGDAVEALERRLTAAGIYCRAVPTRYAFHSHHMEGLRDDLVQSLAGVCSTPATVRLYSTVHGTPHDGRGLGAEYWWQNVRQPVRFGDAIAAMIGQGCSVFVELGPHPVLASAISECLFARDHRAVVLPSLNRREPDRQTMIGSLGALHTAGVKVDWDPLYAGRGPFVEFPPVAWAHERYWVQTDTCRQLFGGEGEHPLLGRRIPGPVPAWESRLDAWRLRYLSDHRVDGHEVFPGAAYIELAVAAWRAEKGDTWPTLESVRLHKGLFPGDDRQVTVRTTFNPDDSAFQIHSLGSEPGAQCQLHATGTLAPPTAAPLAEVDVLEAARRCSRTLNADEAYARLGRAGLEVRAGVPRHQQSVGLDRRVACSG